jgi:alpha-beta hydrolase superfamily lysophospholipase
MGALIAAEWGLSRGRHVSGFVFSSPYFAPAERPPFLQVLAARAIGRVIPWLPFKVPFRETDLTTDADHVRWTERDPLYGHATTPRWFDESTRAQEEVRRRRPAGRSGRGADLRRAGAGRGQAVPGVRGLPTRDLQRGRPRAAPGRGRGVAGAAMSQRARPPVG